ncbi:HlyD family efflux transporter periplasmic adaptor subunit [Kistimonas scapharcae]|uniref:HlyD family efflux transporter periplasmic adaptor subunit n=1 Tax=Kistimonas scapharcae TaxID=1036133 RepID=A0ABP8V1X6_9GAMM
MPKPPVPALRQDLELLPGEPDVDGSPIWLLHDPLSNRFFRLGETEVDILSCLDGSDAETVAQKATVRSGHTVSSEDVETVFAFLRNNHLVEADSAQHTWFERQLSQKPAFFQKLLKTYLFVRIPLVRPDCFLTRTLSWVRWLGSRYVLMALTVCAVVGLIMVGRQFDQFLTTFQHFFNVQGLAAYGLTLFVIKLLHELGHAWVAKAKGCRVPVMGVALLVGWPVLYTDTSDAWRVTRRKDRLAIGAAGVAVELGVAAVALLAWSLTPEGVWRSIFFLLATTTWLLSVLVNFNPLMRFDGYYLISDTLRVPNLESRSFALSRWWLRERLFGLGEAPPEQPRALLIGYAIAVWFYRFLLFLGIALLVYHFFFKVLGLFLFVVEIGYFIVRPIWNEIREWHDRRRHMRWNRATVRTTGLLVTLLFLCLVPWHESVTMPAWLQGQYTTIYAPVSGRLSTTLPETGQAVAKGEVLFQVSAPELEQEVSESRLRLRELAQKSRAIGFDPKLREQALVIRTELSTQLQNIRSLKARQQRLIAQAPYEGVVTDLSPEVRTGQWVTESEPLLSVLDQTHPQLIGYLDESALMRVQSGMTGFFYPEKGRWSPIPVTVEEVETRAIHELDSLYSASLFGGDLAVRETRDRELIPVKGTYRVFFYLPDDSVLPERVLRGAIVINAASESLVTGWWRKVVAMLHRESGF